MALGLNKGDHIAVWAINLPEWLLLEMAAAKVGLVLVTVNPVLQAHEVEYILKQGDVQVLFFTAKLRDHDCLATVRTLTNPGSPHGAVKSERLPLLRYVCLLGAPPADLGEQDGWRPAYYQEMVAGGAAGSSEAQRERQASVKPADPALLMYTSGTTGFPKGAIHSHRAIINEVMLIMRRFGNAVEPGDRCCLPMPFFHIAGAGVVVAAIVAKMVLHPLIAFDPLKMLHIVHQEGCHMSFTVPTMLMALLQHPEFEAYRPTSLKIVASGAAPVPVSLMEQVKERMRTDIAILFGQTEATGVITQTLPEDTFERKAATVGLPLPHVEVKIIHPATGEIVPCGERGELCCRGFLVMTGYYNMPEKTAETIDSDGWLHTGDLATMNVQGYLNIVGRLKEMVIRGGENLFPAEIEAFLIRHPKVADVQVIGVPDAFFGEELLAVVISKAGEQLTEEEVRAYCQGRISHQKIPRYFQFVDSYPLTASGKVQKFVLRESAIKTLGLEEMANVRTA
jgi:fatty-acyl-CoA synthase